jgi:hypothetical protein
MQTKNMNLSYLLVPLHYLHSSPFVALAKKLSFDPSLHFIGFSWIAGDDASDAEEGGDVSCDIGIVEDFDERRRD